MNIMTHYEIKRKIKGLSGQKRNCILTNNFEKANYIKNEIEAWEELLQLRKEKKKYIKALKFYANTLHLDKESRKLKEGEEVEIYDGIFMSVENGQVARDVLNRK